MSFAIGAHRAPVAAPGGAPADRALAGMIARGHGRDACAAYLGLTDAALMERVVRLDLPTPAGKPLPRRARGAWAPDDVRRMVECWAKGVPLAAIGAALGRSFEGVRNKARRLGLPRRPRRDLLRQLPLFPDLDLPAAGRRRREIAWTDDLERWLAERWLAFQHHKAIARDLSSLLGAPVSATTVASKAHRLELPQRDKYFLLDTYAPGNRERHAHLLPRVVERRCKIRGRLFWSTGDRTSQEAKGQALYHSLCSGIPDTYAATMH